MTATAVPFALRRARRTAPQAVARWGVPAATLLVLGALLATALLADAIAVHSPTETSLPQRLLPPLTPGYPLGTDGLGRDLLSRIVHGARISLAVATVAVSLAGSAGTALGLVAGYHGRRIDDLIMRTADMLLGFPLMVFAILLAGVFGPSFHNVVIILAVAQWPRFARIARGETLALKEKEFVTAALLLGLPTWRIMWRHILPHLLNSLLIMASLSAASAVIVEASLSFFGAGVPPPAPSWGGMINDGREFVTTAWWVSFLPGVAIVLMVLSLNLAGDWLRDELDPRLRRAL